MRSIDADDFISQMKDLYHRAGWDEREVHFSLQDLICNIDNMKTVGEKTEGMRLIDANALIENLRKDPLFDLVEKYGLTGVIEAQPTIDAQPVKRGVWMADGDGYADGYLVYDTFTCSECGEIFEGDEPTFNYCPNCGAKMQSLRKEQET